VAAALLLIKYDRKIAHKIMAAPGLDSPLRNKPTAVVELMIIQLLKYTFVEEVCG
jgi:hypothetical protein